MPLPREAHSHLKPVDCISHKLVYSPQESRHSKHFNVQQMNRNAYHQTRLPGTPPRQDDSESLYVDSSIPLVNIMIAPPIELHPSLISYLSIHSTVNANQEWSHPFCSRPWVRSSKGPKPVVMRWPERVLPRRLVFVEHHTTHEQ